MRPYPATRRLLGRQHRRKRLKPGWFLVISVLLGINAYLLFVRGLPTGGQPATTAAAGSARQVRIAAAGPSLAHDLIEPSLRQMRGVAGIRSDASPGLVPAAASSSLRFSMEEAQVVPGLRSLEQWCQSKIGTVARSDTFASALQREGLSRSQVFELVEAIRGTFDFRGMRAGECFEILQSPSNRVERFVYRKSPLVSYRVERSNGRLVGRKQVEDAELEVVPIALRIHDSLCASMYRQGESPALVMMLVDIFAWDIDFYIDTHEGDSIRLLVEKLMVGDEFVRYGRILAAEYKGDIGVHRAFRYETRDGTNGYYDENGDSLRKAFLKSPLKFTRVSSDFGMRVHPVLGFSRMHLGIDLAAPTGTPIWAPGDGVVTFAGYKGVNGNLVTIRHANGYETVFAHLHTIAKGTRRGARVTQKQVIGTVGSTGRSTGPHLHYGMKKNGKHINPFTQKFPPARPVPATESDSYREHIAPLIEQLRDTPLPPVTRTAAIRGERRDTG